MLRRGIAHSPRCSTALHHPTPGAASSSARRHQRSRPDRGRLIDDARGQARLRPRQARPVHHDRLSRAPRQPSLDRINNRGEIVGIYSRRLPPNRGRQRALRARYRGRGFNHHRCPGRRDDAAQRHQQPRSGGGRVPRRRRHGPRLPVGQGSASPPSTGRTATGASATDINDHGADHGRLTSIRPTSRGPGTRLRAERGGLHDVRRPRRRRSPSPSASTIAARSSGCTTSDLALTELHGFLLRKGVRAPSPRSTSRARPAPWRSASTTAARSSASTRTPMPRRMASRAPCRCR